MASRPKCEPETACADLPPESRGGRFIPHRGWLAEVPRETIEMHRVRSIANKSATPKRLAHVPKGVAWRDPGVGGQP